MGIQCLCILKQLFILIRSYTECILHVSKQTRFEVAPLFHFDPNDLELRGGSIDIHKRKDKMGSAVIDEQLSTQSRPPDVVAASFSGREFVCVSLAILEAGTPLARLCEQLFQQGRGFNLLSFLAVSRPRAQLICYFELQMSARARAAPRIGA